MANASYLKKFDPIQEATKYSYGIRTGVRVAADFTITLGFKPTAIRVVNLTDRIEATHFVDPAPVPAPATTTYGLNVGANAYSILTIADGTRTYEACGIALTSSGLGFTVTVATQSLEVDDKDTFWEAWG